MAQKRKTPKPKTRLPAGPDAPPGAAEAPRLAYVPQAPAKETAGRQSAIIEPSPRSAVAENLSLLRQRISPATKLCAVVKANCYGHGLQELSGVIASGADALGVATAQEALEVRRTGYDGPLLAFFPVCAHTHGGGFVEALDQLIAMDVTLTVVTADEAHAVAQASARLAKPANVHVKVDTGMGRSGAPTEAARQLVDLVRKLPAVNLTGMYTHFASADEADKTPTLDQLDRFAQVVNACGAHVGLTLHAANSAATIDLPQTHWDMVRPGIAIYGYQPSDQIKTKLPLRPSLRLSSRLVLIKDVPAGSSVGYGLTYTFPKPGRIGLVPVGYADGYMLSLSGKSTMRIRGRDVPVRGRISMDQTTVDLTDLPEAQVGDEVEIISPDPQAPHSVENLARLAGTIPYEIVCRLGRRVRRVPAD